MKIFRGFDTLGRFVRPAVTVGSYDGVHSGHRALLRALVEAARAQGGESVVCTFEPHPRITLGRADGLRLLTTLDEKAWLLERAEVDNLVVIPFDEAFSRLTPEAFVHDYLLVRAGAETLIVGHDHRFGHGGAGNYDLLDGLELGLRIVRVAECGVAWGDHTQHVSSTAIRRLVAQGDMAQAAALLGHPYVLIGKAAPIGKEEEAWERCQRHGAPIAVEESTSRLLIDEPLKLLPLPGMYEVRVDGCVARLRVGEVPGGDGVHGGAASDVGGATPCERSMPELTIEGLRTQGRVMITF